jgi:hypothetical protein
MIITAAEVRALAKVIDACDREVPVTWASGNATLTGVIRHLHAGPSQDVRDLTVRISGIAEFTFPMADILTMVADGEMALDYRP